MISAPVSIGELLDKITILEIKLDKITDPIKLANVRNELTCLLNIVEGIELDKHLIAEPLQGLSLVNQQLWDIEDAIRIKEKLNEFDDDFIALARSVYKTNDRRAAFKREINVLLNSTLVEEKEYT